MEVLKFEHSISRIDTPKSLTFEGKTFLWVIHADKIPPHIGVSYGNAFFSLKANGKDEALPIEKILRVLNRKKVATLFYEVDNSAILENPQVVFSRYEKTIPEEVTCLNPLKFLFDSPSSTWIKELLADLEYRKVVHNVFGWQLPVDFVQIPDYSPRDIHQRLKQLKNV